MTRASRAVIVGTGHAGFAAAAALRRADPERLVCLIGDEEHLPYQRPPISKGYLLGDLPVERLRFRPETYFGREGIEVILSDPAVTVDRVAGCVALASGRRIPYDDLVLATGSLPRALEIEGRDLAGVHSLRSIADADALRGRLAGASTAAVIGGGFIGLEFAAVCAARDVTATIVHRSDRLLSRSVSPRVSDFLAGRHRDWGNIVLTGARSERLVGSGGSVTGIVLDDGREVAAEVVIVGVGSTANTSLAEESGLEVDDGVLVDRLLTTSDPHVYAVGDCARMRGHSRYESVQNANDQGRHVAAAICGADDGYAATPWFWSDQRDVKLQIAGDVVPGGDEVLIGDPAAGEFSVFGFGPDGLTAVESINRARDHVAARKLLDAGTRLFPGDIVDGFSLPEYVASL